MVTKTARAIGNYVVALIQPKTPISPSCFARMPCMQIMQDSSVDDGVYSPPQSVCVYSEDSIRALRDACNEALGEEVKP